jgi:hypothetical protein
MYMKTIILYGLRRSGNHFIISTILEHYSNYVHVGNTALSYDKYLEHKNIEKDKDRVDLYWTGFKGVDCVVISMENKEINFNELKKFDNVEDCHVMMLLRSPYSHFSSVWKVYGCPKRLLQIVNLWKVYAKLFINANDDTTNESKLIRILYDKYAQDDNYISEILKTLGVNFTEIKKDKPIMWQESSFQNKNLQQKKYDTLESCIYGNDNKFVQLVGDPEIHDLWNRVALYFK